MKRLDRKYHDIGHWKNYLDTHKITPEEANAHLEKSGTSPLEQKTSLAVLLQRPQVFLEDLEGMSEAFRHYTETYRDNAFYEELREEVEISIKYDSYIKKEEENAARLSKYENLPLKPDFDYTSIKSLSFEAREKLGRLRPATLGQASRIPGVSPADISVLLVWLNK